MERMGWHDLNKASDSSPNGDRVSNNQQPGPVFGPCPGLAPSRWRWMLGNAKRAGMILLRVLNGESWRELTEVDINNERFRVSGEAFSNFCALS